MALVDKPLRVTVVSADRIVWEGEANSVVARTTEGDIGILSHHEPMLAALVPCAAEVIASDGTREIIAVDGGFISVADNEVSLLSQYASISSEISVHEAEAEYAAARKAIEAGDENPALERHMARAEAQLKAAHKAAGLVH